MNPTDRTYEIAGRIRATAERLGVSPVFLAARVIEEMEAPARAVGGLVAVEDRDELAPLSPDG